MLGNKFGGTFERYFCLINTFNCVSRGYKDYSGLQVFFFTNLHIDNLKSTVCDQSESDDELISHKSQNDDEFT